MGGLWVWGLWGRVEAVGCHWPGWGVPPAQPGVVAAVTRGHNHGPHTATTPIPFSLPPGHCHGAGGGFPWALGCDELGTKPHGAARHGAALLWGSLRGGRGPCAGPWPRAAAVTGVGVQLPGHKPPFRVPQVLIPGCSPASSSAGRLGAASAPPGPRSHVHLPAGERGGLLRDGGRAGQVSDIPLLPGCAPCPTTALGALPGCCGSRGVPVPVASPVPPLCCLQAEGLGAVPRARQLYIKKKKALINVKFISISGQAWQLPSRLGLAGAPGPSRSLPPGSAPAGQIWG